MPLYSSDVHGGSSICAVTLATVTHTMLGRPRRVNYLAHRNIRLCPHLLFGRGRDRMFFWRHGLAGRYRFEKVARLRDGLIFTGERLDYSRRPPGLLQPPELPAGDRIL